MKIAIPSKDGKLCAHFGNSDNFTFVEINDEKKEIQNSEVKTPEGGVSCQSAGWVADQGVDVVLAGGMGGRPLSIFVQKGVQVIPGCPELPIEELVKAFLAANLITGENSCSGHNHEHCHHNESEHNGQCHHHGHQH